MSSNREINAQRGKIADKHIIKKIQDDDGKTYLQVFEHDGNAYAPPPSPVKYSEHETEHYSSGMRTPRSTSANQQRDLNASPLPPFRVAFPKEDVAAGTLMCSPTRRAASRGARYTPYSRTAAKAMDLRLGTLSSPSKPSSASASFHSNVAPQLTSLTSQRVNNRIIATVPAVIGNQLLAVAYGSQLYPHVLQRSTTESHTSSQPETPEQDPPHVIIDLTCNPIAEFLWDACRLHHEVHLRAFRIFMELGIRRLEHLDMVAKPEGTEKLCTQLENKLFWIHILSIHLGLLKHRESMENNLAESSGEGNSSSSA